MLDPKQAEIVGDVLMAEQIAVQRVAADKKMAAERRAVQQGRVARWALAGMVAGALIGYVALVSWVPTALIGLGLGALSSRLVYRGQG